MKKFFILFLLITAISHFHSYGESTLSLLSMIRTSPEGSYMILENNQTHVAVVLKEKQNESLILHEICFSKNSSKNLYHWKQRLLDDTSYFAKFETVIEENSIKTTPIFYKKNKKISKEQAFSFTSLLTSLSFFPLPQENIKMTKDISHNPIPWKPKLTVEGRAIDYSECMTYEAYWPKDGSVMSNKRIEIYFPLVNNRNFLYFPIWLEIESPLGKIKIRAIDSGILDPS